VNRKVVLFRPMSQQFQGKLRHPPWGLLYTAAPLAAQGYEVRIIDAPHDPEWKKTVAEAAKGAFCVGITAMTGYQIEQGIECARIAREVSDAKIIWGGVHPSLLPRQTVSHPLVDIVVKGEGEATMAELVNALDAGSDLASVQGICFSDNGDTIECEDRPFINLDDLPPIPFDLVRMENYFNSSKRGGYQRLLEVLGSRGCPHRCGFCYNLKFNKRKWRTRSIDNIINDIKLMIDRFRMDGITWREDNFFVSKARVKEICERLIAEKIKVKWRGNCRCDYFVRYEDDFIELLKESGCILLSFGIESGSQAALDRMQKDITVEQILETAARLRKHRIAAGFQVMIGLPDETKEDRRQTYSLLYKLRREYPEIDLQGPAAFTPYPGSTLYYRSIELGFQPPESLEGWGRFNWSTSNLPWFTRREARHLAAASNVIHKAYSSRFLTRTWAMARFWALKKFNIAWAPGRYLSPLVRRMRYYVKYLWTKLRGAR